jgi:hypothetical protein
MDNLNRYVNAVKAVESMFLKGIITEVDFIKAESELARKHCIKPNSIFKLNDLINEAKRVINSNTKKQPVIMSSDKE